MRSQWTLSITALEILREKFDKRVPIFDYRKTEDNEPDIRHEACLRMQGSVFYANLFPFDLSLDTEMDWEGVRGWFGECVQVSRKRG